MEEVGLEVTVFSAGWMVKHQLEVDQNLLGRADRISNLTPNTSTSKRGHRLPPLCSQPSS